MKAGGRRGKEGLSVSDETDDGDRGGLEKEGMGKKESDEGRGRGHSREKAERAMVEHATEEAPPDSSDDRLQGSRAPTGLQQRASDGAAPEKVGLDSGQPATTRATTG